MSQFINITASDGFSFAAYHVPAKTARKGGLIIVQEIFGVNKDIRATSEDFAALGYEVLAPSMYDRLQPRFEVDSHDAAAIEAARPLAMNNGFEKPVLDIQACVDQLRSRGPVFITGYCYGGTIAWVGATQVKGIAASSSFYGSMVPNMAHQKPHCPVIVHFGKNDSFIPQENIDRLKAERPEVPVYMYDAGHGFFTRGGMDYNKAAHDLALERTLALFNSATPMA